MLSTGEGWSNDKDLAMECYLDGSTIRFAE